MTTATLTPAPAATQALNINDASKACGLSPSVLRIWELRYGWPNPRRRANGYRAYTFHQVQELKRVAQLVRIGTPISQLIVDGLPRFPADNQVAQVPRGLPRTRALPRARSAAVARMQDEVIGALDTRNALGAQERLQRAVWQLRPADEPAAVMVPILCAIAEARANGRPFAEEAALTAGVRTRTQQIQRMMRQVPGALRIVPLGDELADTTAQLVALILNQRCQPATYVPAKTADKTPWIAVGDGDATGAAGHVTAFGGEGRVALADLLDAAKLLPWSQAKA
jgi:DNA-binding transcriptional MerR regulator